jgi:pSer/pThr/pTyr-binding forkhead associated (FHA) protein
MRLEVLVGNSDPQVFPLNRPKIIIGSHESCDIILQSEGVSRKHLIVLTENDNYFVIDQGSVNGTFMNDERLVPGRRVEFTSFFPIRIADNILITLLSDEEASDGGITSELNTFVKEEISKPTTKTTSSYSSSLQDATRAISLKDLQQAKTENLIKKRTETLSKKKAPPQSKKLDDSKRMKGVLFFTLLIFGFAFYWNVFLKQGEGEEILDQKAAETAPQAKTVQQVASPPPPTFRLVDESVIVSKEKYAEILQNMQCMTDIEKYFCEKIKSIEKSSVQIGTTLYIFFDGSDYYLKAKDYLKAPVVVEGELVPVEKLEQYKKDLLYVSILLYFYQEIPRDLDYSLLKDLNLVFVMKVKIDEKTSDYATLAFHPETLEKFLPSLEQRYFELTRKFGAETLYFLKEYFRYF